MVLSSFAARSGKGATGHLLAASSQPHEEDSNESRQARETGESWIVRETARGKAGKRR